MKAYITLLSTMSYLPGVLALNESLLRVKSRQPLWVALSSKIPQEVGSILKRAGMQPIYLPDSISIPMELREGSGHWGNTFDKLHLFGLINFSKLVYVDSDMIVLTNIDHLFDSPHMSAVAAGRSLNPEWDRLNSGLMVLVPELGLPEKIVSTLPKAIEQITALGATAIGDQDLINAYFHMWPQSSELHLDEGYNIFQCHLDTYIKQYGYKFPDNENLQERIVKIVHFIGPHKPWMRNASLRHYAKMIKKWSGSRWERKAFSLYIEIIKYSRKKC